jgi:hypothetical protein
MEGICLELSLENIGIPSLATMMLISSTLQSKQRNPVLFLQKIVEHGS